MRLNGVGNVEVREGDLFDPVRNEKFGLIVSNPPFVISPESRFIYRDSGLAGDDMCRRIVAEAPAHLEDGGYCQLLANWAHLETGNWQDRLEEWITDIGCDAWIVQTSVQDAETYAATWLRQEGQVDDAAQFDTWMDHYEQIGLEAVGFGVITLRRTQRPQPWLCLEELAREFVLPCGDDIAARFDRAAWLDGQGREDRALLESCLVINYDVVLREMSYGAEGRWHTDELVVELQHGLRYANTVDRFGAQLIAGCDGATPLADLVAQLAHELGLRTADVTAQTLALVRRLIGQGIVTPG